MKRLATTALLMALALGVPMTLSSYAGQPKRPTAGEKPKTYQGLSATLTVAGSECKLDGPLELCVTLAAAGEAHKLFNPFFNGLLEQPGRILIRDSGGTVVNRLLDFHGGSRRTPGEGDYVTLPGGGLVGKKLTVYPSRKGEGIESLPPGDYTMQLVLYGSLLGLSGQDAAREVATSEWVPFRIVK
jgi:hypothetical protein